MAIHILLVLQMAGSGYMSWHPVSEFTSLERCLTAIDQMKSTDQRAKTYLCVKK